jgi:CheY-like chemotaxis protein
MKKRTLLIVDDDERNIFALSAVIRTKGFLIEKALDGEAAIKILEDNADIDLVLMDIMMPVMDGYEAIQSIRANSVLKNTPIIALTAKAMKGDQEKCLDAGATDYCAKPVDVTDLLKKIENCLKK